MLKSADKRARFSATIIKSLLKQGHDKIARTSKKLNQLANSTR
jgi:hypothetical protein